MLLELDHISKIYGDLHAVDDLNLTVPVYGRGIAQRIKGTPGITG